MPDGRIEAIKVTGPGGENVKGQPHPKDDEEDKEEEEPEQGAGGKMPAEPKPKLKPYTAFMPRTVARKPVALKPKAPVGGAGASAASAPPSAPPSAASSGR